MDAVIPLASIYAAIGPVHLTIALFDIKVIVALVIGTRSPSELAEPVLHILMVLTFVGICYFFCSVLLPHTLSLFHTFDEDTRVSVTVGPTILTIAVSFSVSVLAEVNITIREDV